MNNEKMNIINIAISVNDGFAIPALVMLSSLFENTARPIGLHLLYNSLSKVNRDKIAKLVKEYGNTYFEHPIESESFAQASLNNNPLYSIEIYYRILLPYITDVKKMLWLDADIIVRGDIEELYDIDITDYYLGAVTDIGEEHGVRENIKDIMSMKENTYFNSGVLLMNLEKIRKEIPFETFVSAIEIFNKDLKCPDQDILNYVLGSKTKILPVYYNDQHHTELNRRYDCSSLIVHYIWSKPWNAKYTGFWETAYWNVANKCGYKKEFMMFCIKRKWKFLRTEIMPAIVKRLWHLGGNGQ